MLEQLRHSRRELDLFQIVFSENRCLGALASFLSSLLLGDAGLLRDDKSHGDGTIMKRYVPAPTRLIYITDMQIAVSMDMSFFQWTNPSKGIN